MVVVAALEELRKAPSGRCPQVRPARKYLEATHESVTGLLDAFELVRQSAAAAKQSTKGRLSRDQLDLLRAALVFTSSGLDACCHRLVRDAAPELIARGGVAQAKFHEFVKQELHEPRPPDGLFEAMICEDPRSALLDRYLTAKTRASFQGSGDLKTRVRDLLGITNKQIPVARFHALDAFFTARNQIVHRLDYEDPHGVSIKRHHRAPTDVLGQCNLALTVVADLIEETAQALRA